MRARPSISVSQVLRKHLDPFALGNALEDQADPERTFCLGSQVSLEGGSVNSGRLEVVLPG